jgi:hypothetical protein
MRAPLLMLSMVLTLPAVAGVTVSFPDAGRHTDAGPAPQAQGTRGEIARHLESLGARYLKPGQELRIEVLDINLGGRVRYDATSDTRVMRAGDWPQMRLRYELDTPGEATRKAEEVVSDPEYLRGPQNNLDALAREKRMLDEWFRARFLRGIKAG